jgi:hypothetical protein
VKRLVKLKTLAANGRGIAVVDAKLLTLAALGGNGEGQEATRAAARLSNLADGGRGHGDHGTHRHRAGTSEFHL